MDMKGGRRTEKSTSRLQRTIPTPPPATCTGADWDVRTCVLNASCSISNVNVSCPEVDACTEAMSKHTAG